MKASRALFAATMLVFVAACASKKPTDTAPAPPTQDVSEFEIGAASTGEDLNAPGGSASGVVVYFDFDSSEVRQEFHDSLRAVAKRLSAGEQLSLRLEGHADERGSREYNVGLGERRAQAVRRFLLLSGVRESQLSTVSYGEERPASVGQTESAWSKNRRVELAGG